MRKLLTQLTVGNSRRLRVQLAKIQPANEKQVLFGKLQPPRKAVGEATQFKDDVLLLHADRR